jgi:peptidoglycan hydrolase CwlO-like protein
MSSYLPPTDNLSVFNPTVFQSGDTEGITLSEADSRYVKKSGSIMTGALSTPSLLVNSVDVGASLTSLQTQITSNDSDITTINTTLTSQQSQITSNDSDITSLQSQITSNDGDISTINGTLTSQQSQITSNDSDITTINGTLTSLQSQITSNDTDITSLQSQITSNDGDITTINTTLTSQQSQITSNDTDITSLQSQITSNDTDITSLQSQITSNDTDITSLQSQITSNDGDISTINSTLTSQQSQITSNDTDITTLQTKTTDLTFAGTTSTFANKVNIVGDLQVNGIVRANEKLVARYSPNSSSSGNWGGDAYANDLLGTGCFTILPTGTTDIFSEVTGTAGAIEVSVDGTYRIQVNAYPMVQSTTTRSSIGIYVSINDEASTNIWNKKDQTGRWGATYVRNLSSQMYDGNIHLDDFYSLSASDNIRIKTKLTNNTTNSYADTVADSDILLKLQVIVERIYDNNSLRVAKSF